MGKTVRIGLEKDETGRLNTELNWVCLRIEENRLKILRFCFGMRRTRAVEQSIYSWFFFKKVNNIMNSVCVLYFDMEHAFTRGMKGKWHVAQYKANTLSTFIWYFFNYYFYNRANNMIIHFISLEDESPIITSCMRLWLAMKSICLWCYFYE